MLSITQMTAEQSAMQQQALPDEIAVTFTNEDLATAKDYRNCEDCLMATALKRLGFKDVAVGGSGVAMIGGIGGAVYAPTTEYDSGIALDEDAVGRRFYRRDLIGKTFILRRKS